MPLRFSYVGKNEKKSEMGARPFGKNEKKCEMGARPLQNARNKLVIQLIAYLRKYIWVHHSFKLTESLES